MDGYEIIRNKTKKQMSLTVKRFTASWCVPCRTLAPMMLRIQSENPLVKFEIIDVEANESISKEYGIRSIPSVILEKDGKIVETIMGAQAESVYTQSINKWK